MKKSLVILLSFFLLSSCSEADFNIELEAPKLVIYAFFELETFMEVEVFSSSMPIGAPSSNEVSNANVLLYEDELLLGKMQERIPGKYSIDRKPKPGSRYQLFVQAEGYPDVQSEVEEMPTFAEIDNIITTEILEDDQLEKPKRLFSQFTIFFNKPIDHSLFFTHHVIFKEALGGKIYWLSSINECSGDISYASIGKLGFSLECFEEIESLILETNNHDIGDQVTSPEIVFLCQINEATHDFNMALENNSLAGGSGLLISPTSVPSNIIGGYGLLSLSNCQTFEIRY